MSGTPGPGPTSTPAPAPAAPKPGVPNGQAGPSVSADVPVAAHPDRLSVSDAQKMLRERRREAAQATPGQGTPPGAAPGAAAPDTPARPATPPAAAPAPAGGESKAAADAVDALLRDMRPGEAPRTATEAPAAAPADGASFTLAIDGHEVRLTHAQMADAWRQAQDYTKKTQQLAEYARTVKETEAAIVGLLPMIESQLKGQLGPEPNWVELAQRDPAAYITERAKWDAAMGEQARLAAMQEVEHRQQTEAANARLAASHRELEKSLPGWADAQRRGQIQAAIHSWAREAGFPQAELSTLSEARHVVALAKAMMFDRMMAGATTQAPLVPQVQGGAAPAPPPTERMAQAEQAFADKPNPRNAAALLSARRAGVRPNGRF